MTFEGGKLHLDALIEAQHVFKNHPAWRLDC